MSKKLGVLVDMDGVLVDTYRPFCREFNRKYGTNITVDDLTDYSFVCLQKKFGATREQFNDIFSTVGLHQSARELPGASAAAKRLSGEGFGVHVATSRSQDLKIETLRWLARYEVPVDSLTIIPTSVFADAMTKNEVSKMHRCYYAVEDAPSYAHNLAKVCAQVYLVDAPYNRDYDEGNSCDNILRVSSLEEAASLIIKEWR